MAGTLVITKKRSFILVALVVLAGVFIYIKHRSTEMQALQQHQHIQSFWKNDNSFDAPIIRVCQQFAGKVQLIDASLVFISTSNLFKTGIIAIAIWWLWFSYAEGSKQRTGVILTLIGTAIALVIGRLCVIGFPYRLRPMRDESLHLTLPYGVNQEALDGFSSFPSDHAILLCALATGLYFVSRKVGMLAFLYAFFLVLLPRVYLCYHYPTDILAGMLVGILILILTFKSGWMQAQAERIGHLSKIKPALFYPIFFLVTFQIACVFDDVRNSITFLSHTVFH